MAENLDMLNTAVSLLMRAALLAARFEISRSPQVERARRQLDIAGIPLLGTVINGMRSSDSYYGRYTYSRQRTSQPDPSSTI